mgnify:CR=1 FL=1
MGHLGAIQKHPKMTNCVILTVAIGVPNLEHELEQVREELRALWTRTGVSVEQLVADLQAWCRKAEESGIAALQEFSFKLRAATA